MNTQNLLTFNSQELVFGLIPRKVFLKQFTDFIFLPILTYILPVPKINRFDSKHCHHPTAKRPKKIVTARFGDHTFNARFCLRF
jgi:hypothetical protein